MVDVFFLCVFVQVQEEMLFYLIKKISVGGVFQKVEEKMKGFFCS